MTFRIQQTWNTNYEDSTSSEYLALKSRIENKVNLMNLYSLSFWNLSQNVEQGFNFTVNLTIARRKENKRIYIYKRIQNKRIYIDR